MLLPGSKTESLMCFLFFLEVKMHQLALKKKASAYHQLNILTRYSLFWTDNWYSVTSQQHEEPTGGDSRPHRAQRSSSGHTRISRAVLGGGLTINTLPDNMTHVVVRELHHSVSYDRNGLWHLLCFWLLTCSICFSWS